MSPHLKDKGTETDGFRCQVNAVKSPPPPRAARRGAGTSGRLDPPPRVSTPGLSSLDKPISRRLQAGSTQDDKSQSNPSRLSHPRAWGWGTGEKTGPSGNSRPRLPEPRDPIGTQPPLPRERGQHCCRSNARRRTLGEAPWRGLEWAGGAGRGEGEREGSGQPPPRSFSGVFHHFSINEPPTTNPRRSRDPAPGPTHNSLISTIFLEPPDSCCRYHLHRRRYRRAPRLRGPAPLITEPARPRPSAQSRRVSAGDGLAPPQGRAPPRAHEASTAAARPAGGRAASTAAAQTPRAAARLLPQAPPPSQSSSLGAAAFR